MGEALRGDADAGRAGRRTAALRRLRAFGTRALGGVALAAALGATVAREAPSQRPGFERLQSGRFTVIAGRGDLPLARSLLAAAAARDTFPGLPRPSTPVLVEIAPDDRRLRQWIGDGAPEWGVAFAIPSERRIVMQGRRASSAAGDPLQVLRHELAHLALHEAMGELPPRWFDEGYASYVAGEWGREEVLATSLALLLRGLPSLDSLEQRFHGGGTEAGSAYALAYRAVSDMAALDPARGLTLFFRYWRRERSMDLAMRAAYGITLHDFERRWRDRTLRRYGALAFVADLSAAVAVLSAVVLPLYLARRRRDRRRLAAMRANEEAAERAARESALDELLRGVSAPQPPPSPPPSPPPLPGA